MDKEPSNITTERLSMALGCFSLGLGLAELVAPEKMARLIGVRNKPIHRNILRAYGAREITAGVGILSQPQQPAWVWSRIAGDALDLASLGSAMLANRAEKTKLGIATAAVAGVAALDVVCAKRLSNSGNGSSQSEVRHLTRTVLINRRPSDVYNFWSNLANLPSFMPHLESVEDLGQGKSLWRARAAGGKIVEWQAEITNDQPNERISWRSLEGALVPNSGTVRFAPGPAGRGTLVRVDLDYQIPGGKLTANLARLFNSEPGQQVADELRHLKQVLETGEVVKSDSSIHPGLHPAQPAKQEIASAAHA